MTTSNKSAAFGNLLKGAINGIANFEGKTAPTIEEELGALIGVSGKTIQRYKTGNLPPFDRDNDAVRVLAEAAVRGAWNCHASTRSAPPSSSSALWDAISGSRYRRGVARRGSVFGTTISASRMAGCCTSRR